MTKILHWRLPPCISVAENNYIWSNASQNVDSYFMNVPYIVHSLCKITTTRLPSCSTGNGILLLLYCNFYVFVVIAVWRNHALLTPVS